MSTGRSVGRSASLAWMLSAILLGQARAQQVAVPAQTKVVESNGEAKAPKVEEAAPQATAGSLNLLGQTNAAGGEARRNENVQINLVDNNSARELNRRVGITATLVEEFRADRGYFASEYGTAPRGPLHTAGQTGSGLHGNLYWGHSNSVFSARSFFQVGGVRPARANQFGGALGTSPWKDAYVSLLGSHELNAGNVNGNVLIPLPGERTPLTNDPVLRPLVQAMLDGYPNVAPNRPDIAARSLNTNSTQRINTDTATGQWTQRFAKGQTLSARYAYTLQRVDAFQFIRGANPDTRNVSHAPRLSWNRLLDAKTVLDVSVGFDRQNTVLMPKPGAPVTSLVTGLSILGPPPTFPLDRAQNRFRYAGTVARQFTRHALTVGATLGRFQYNGYEDETSRGIFQFRDEFGRTAIDNLRLGTPSSYTIALGTTYRGFRNWDAQAFVGDRWTVRRWLTLSMALRYEPVTRPEDVTGRSNLLFDSDWNNVGGSFGLVLRLPGSAGIVRSAYGVMQGQIFPATYGIDRWNAPHNPRVTVNAPALVNPLGAADIRVDPNSPTTVFGISPDLATPYAHQYNFSWERDVAKGWNLQLGYAGSRTQKLFAVYILNRARVVPGVPFTTATINQRRPDARKLEYDYLNNVGRSYYDAARATLRVPRWRGLNLNASYWFSKSIDLGTDYNATGAALDARRAGAQTEFENHRDMKALSSFDQPHAVLVQAAYAIPAMRNRAVVRLARGWNITLVSLLKSGTPFLVDSGSDGPGIGNVDGTLGDRPMLLDPSVLGRTIGNPDTSRELLPRSAFRFIRAPEEMRGNLGRNVFRKGKIANFNASIERSWRVHADWSLNLRAESNNLLNTPQFAEPGTSLTSPNFGQITNTLNDGRSFRFQLRMAF